MKKLLQAIVSAVVIASAFTGTSHAAGTASFSLSPNSGNREKGSNFTVQVHENGNDVNTVNAKLTYDAAKLSCKSIGASAAFPNTVTASCSNGSVTITRYTNPGEPAKSGDQIVGSITFTALADSGTTSVNFAAGSQIASNGSNIWNGATAGGTYTLIAPVVSTTNPSTPAPTTPAPKAKTSSTTKNTTAVAGQTDSNQPAATPTSTPATAEQPKTEDANKPAAAAATNQGNNAAWILGGILIAALLGAGLYYLNNRAAQAQAAEAAAAAAAARKTAKTAPAKKTAAKRTAKTAKK